MLSGSCCCGAITFKVSRKPEMMGTCHCTRCRKVGASTFVFVAKHAFELTSGADAVATYRGVGAYKYDRCFCSNCGTALGEITSEAESFPIPANCFDGEIGLENRFHEFVKEKPSWYSICDSAVQFSEHPHK